MFVVLQGSTIVERSAQYKYQAGNPPPNCATTKVFIMEWTHATIYEQKMTCVKVFRILSFHNVPESAIVCPSDIESKKGSWPIFFWEVATQSRKFYRKFQMTMHSRYIIVLLQVHRILEWNSWPYLNIQMGYIYQMYGCGNHSTSEHNGGVHFVILWKFVFTASRFATLNPLSLTSWNNVHGRRNIMERSYLLPWGNYFS